MQAFLIDTNVLSELMRAQPDKKVFEWFDAHFNAECYVSAVTKAEIFLGIRLLPKGKRQERLTEAAEKMFAQEFVSRCLPFDEKAADLYAQIVAERTRIGKPVSTEDAQIAAIAMAFGLDLVTRNIKDFEGINGLKTMNPWDGN